jgi:2Fe-2S ferredoxin
MAPASKEIMPFIQFIKNRQPIFAEEGSNLMKALLNAGLPVASSCGGDGICGKCRITILTGMEHLSLPSGQEQFLAKKLNFKATERLSCQVLLKGDVTVDATYW